MIFLVLSGKTFSRKHGIFSLGEGCSFSKKVLQTWRDVPPPSYPAKKSKMTFSRKITPKDDWHPRKGSIILCTLTETFMAVLYIAAQRKKPGNLIYRINVWILPQFIRLEIFCNGESSILCTIQQPGVVFGGVLECQSRKLFCLLGDGL